MEGLSKPYFSPKLNVFIEEALKHFENTVNSFDPRKKPNQWNVKCKFFELVESCIDIIYKVL